MAGSNRRPRSRHSSMWRTPDLLGKTFLDKQSEPLLTIGKDVWSRQEVVDQLHCGNFIAAHNLTKIADKLQVESLDQLVSRFSLEDLFQERGVGLTTVYVLMCAQEAKQHDPLAWVDRQPDHLVTLGTEQRRARKQQRETRKAARAAARRARKPLEDVNGVT